ncbi:MAG: CPBP family intramembrane metalloprotease [Planctomycetaceae bacterium]|nr:CPBP family intramembrane metalloprotease [Planctomycetaceae bacterium]
MERLGFALLLLLLLYLSIIAVGFVAYLVMELGTTNDGLRLFRVLFPPRRQRTVPWGVSAIPLALAVYLMVMLLSQWFVLRVIPGVFEIQHNDNVLVFEAVDRPTDNETDRGVTQPISDEELPDQHPLTILMQKNGQNPMVILVCFLTAVIVAPLTEEFMFRVVIQGGIEAKLRRGYGHSAPAQRIPILLTALFFAAIHFRTQQETTPSSIDRIFQAMTATLIGNLVAMAVVIVVFRRLFRIRWSDIGLWDFRRTGRDALGALLLLVTILIPIGVVKYVVDMFAKSDGAVQLGVTSSMVDPIPLFLFALVIGTLYHRTRRFASVFFLHAFFNLYSFMILVSMTW